jgi:hypothetical protein
MAGKFIKHSIYGIRKWEKEVLEQRNIPVTEKERSESDLRR